MYRDYVLNGVGHGPVGEVFNVKNPKVGAFDPGLLRPYIETRPNHPFRGRPCADVLTGNTVKNPHHKPGSKQPEYVPERLQYLVSELQSQGVNSPVFNATTLTRDDWVAIDRTMVDLPRKRNTAYNDLRAKGGVVGGFDAWSKLTLEYLAQSDAGEVIKDMDATSPGRDDTPLNLIRSVPLPVIHGDFSFPQRYIDMTRAAGRPIDTSMFRQVGLRFWESVEKTWVGTEAGMTFGTRSTGLFPHTGTSTEYGLTTFPSRAQKTDLTTPDGTNPDAVVQDVIEMMETMYSNNYFGPFTLYHSTPYSQWFNRTHFVGTYAQGLATGGTTLRAALTALDGISEIKRLDYLTSGYQLVLVDYGSNQFEAVDGMQPRPVQWSERGGYVQKFMLLGIQTQIMRAPYSGSAAIVHGTTTP
jgi:hypothetical protein